MFISSASVIVLAMTTTIDETTYPDSTNPVERTDRRRRVLGTARLAAFYVPLVAAAVMAVMFLPELLASLVTGWTAEGAAELGIHRLHIMGIATVVSVFLLGLFAQAYQPKKRVAAMWGAFLTILAVSVGTVAYDVGRPEEVIPFLLVTSVALVAHPAGRQLFRRGDSYSPALLGLLGVAALPLVAFAVSQLSMSSNGLDPHAVDGHYVMMVGLVTATLAYGLFAALGFAGWRLAAVLAAIPMVYYGLMSIAFPLQAGSTGAVWGAAAIIWAIAFVAIAEYSRVGESRILRRAS